MDGAGRRSARRAGGERWPRVLAILDAMAVARRRQDGQAARAHPRHRRANLDAARDLARYVLWLEARRVRARYPLGLGQEDRRDVRAGADSRAARSLELRA